jgi:hypothetical protein
LEENPRPKIVKIHKPTPKVINQITESTGSRWRDRDISTKEDEEIIQTIKDILLYTSDEGFQVYVLFDRLLSDDITISIHKEPSDPNDIRMDHLRYPKFEYSQIEDTLSDCIIRINNYLCTTKYFNPPNQISVKYLCDLGLLHWIDNKGLTTNTKMTKILIEITI